MGPDIKAKLSLDGDDFEKGVEDAADATEAGSSKMEAAWKKVNKAANIAGLAVVGLAGLAMKAASDFETAFVDVEQSVNGTIEELADLREGILDMANELPYSQEELANTAAAVGDLGVAAPLVEEVTRAMADFGSATGQAASESAKSLGDLSKALQVLPEQIDDLASSIVGVADHFQTSEKAVVAIADRLAETGRAAGLTAEQILGISGALASVGGDAEANGTAVSQALAAMSKAVADGTAGAAGLAAAEAELVRVQEALAEATAGLDAGAVADSARAHDALAEATGEADAAQEKYKDTGNQLKRLELDLQGARAAGNKEQAAAIAAQILALKGERLEIELTLDAAKEKVEVLEAEYEASQAALGAQKDIVAAAQEAVDAQTKQIAKLREGSDALTNFASIAGVSVTEFSRLFSEDAAGALELFLAGVKKIDEEKGNTIGALDSVGLAGGRTRDGLLKAADASVEFKAGIDEASKAMSDHTALQEEAEKRNSSSAAQFQILKNQVNDLAIEVGNDLLPVVMSFLNDYVKPVVKWLKDHKDIVVPLAVAIGIMALAVKAINFAMAIWNIVVQLAALVNWYWTKSIWAVNTALSANPIAFVIYSIILLIAIIVTLISCFGDWGAIIDWVGAIFSKFIAYTVQEWDDLLLLIQFVISKIVEAWDWFIGIIKGSIDGLVAKWDEFALMIQTAFQGVSDFFVGIWDGIVEAFQVAWDKVLEIWAWVQVNLIDPIKAAFQGVSDFFVRIWDGIKAAFQTVWDGIVGIFKTAVNTVIRGINTLINGLNAIVDGINWVLKQGASLIGQNPDNVGIGRIGTIPELAVGGDIESDGLAFLHAGERVMRAADVDKGAGQGGGFSVKELHFAPVIQGTTPDYDVDRLGELFVVWLRDRKVTN